MESSLIEKVVLVALGWLLGLAAPAITEAIKRRRENALGRAAIVTELHEVAYKLALSVHGVYMHRGDVDRVKLEWLHAVMERYSGLHDPGNLLMTTRAQLSWTDEQIALGTRAMAKGPDRFLNLQKYKVPLLDARVAALWSFDTSHQRHLLEIRAGLDMLDDIVERSRHFSDMTFGKLEPGMFDRVIENVEQSYEQFVERARIVVGNIDKFISLER